MDISSTFGTRIAAQEKWPADPYKGLTFYGPHDIPLFAGRSVDVRKVARILGAGNTRIFLLHGSTGCGKSSFLRAALIPFLEDQVARFSFAREDSPTAETALFVRSSHDPLVELASKAWEYARGLQTTESAANATESTATASESGAKASASSRVTTSQPVENASDASSESRSKQAVSDNTSKVSRYSNVPILDLNRYPTLAKFTTAVSEDPERLVEMIGRIAYRHPRTQALVVDQAEEVLTLKPGADGEDARRRFFMFLTYLSYSDINFRLLVVFRTEYHGRFYASLKAAGIDAASVEDYYLSDLTGNDLIEAITRPTLAEEIPGYGIPRDHYRFYYEPELPGEIARDLEKARMASGTLPVLQIVCRRLHQKATASGSVDGYRVITQKAYKDLGGIQGQVDLHLQQALENCCDALKPSRFIVNAVESLRWRDVLSELAKPQPDSTVTTDVKTEKVLVELAALKACRLPFDKTMQFLQKDEWKIVRPVELRKPTGEKVPCYSLGHDVLGGVLDAWKAARVRDRRQVRQGLLWMAAAFVIASFVVNADQLRKLGLAQPLDAIRILLWVLAGASMALAAIPDNRAFAFLYRPIYGFLTELSGVRLLPGAKAEPK